MREPNQEGAPCLEWRGKLPRAVPTHFSRAERLETAVNAQPPDDPGAVPTLPEEQTHLEQQSCQHSILAS